MPEQTAITVANQTQVPAVLRKANHVGAGDIVVWDPQPDGTAVVRFRRRHRLEDMIGLVPGAGGGNAVLAKKRAQRGGR